jgi:signal transduction histidine kinase
VSTASLVSPLRPWVFPTVLGAVAFLAVVDVAVEQLSSHNLAGALIVAAGVAVACALLRVNLTLAAVAMAGLSLGVSIIGDRAWHLRSESDEMRRLWVLSTTTFPLFTELFAIGALCALVVWKQTAQRSIPVVAVLLAVLVTMSRLRWSDRGADIRLLAFSVGLAASVGGGVWLRWLDSSRANADQLARQDERIALARDVHDLIAHHMTGIALHAQAGQMVLPEDPQTAAACLHSIEESVTEALRSMRAVVGTLRAGDLTAYSPVATINDLRALATGPGDPGLVVTVEVAAGIEAFSEPVIAAIHRMTLEAISNAQRHAVAATSVVASVGLRNDEVIVRVHNDGEIASSPRGSGFGLIGIDERVRELGGEFHAGPVAAGGWEVLVRLPGIRR